ncbi:MAG: metal-dependent transcriptional regulator [Candidatus Omnitrophica bacterium]|nr:metal-dependent transcriptional regulator [Candidatus Omnitrophota bacterium]MBU1997402.1 metal-dependent transcriptional regulator [Candidatus Omnitrophota bacterium]MBU4333306.1 metal-dependent transcriptional regulator [Candidatus Omnitrophota bacterium]
MNNKNMQEEHLEKLWNMKEEGKDSIEDLKEFMGKDYDLEIVKQLEASLLVETDTISKKIKLTEEGEAQGRRLIRAHRIAERMLHDVVGGDFEKGACEFEHTVTLELVDSICTLLGHPKECPHGLPIPKGECCKMSKRTAESSVVSLTDLKVGQSARVAYVITKDDQQLHKIDGLHIRPGAVVKLHQDYPTYVIECEGVNIALDGEVALNINVWKDSKHLLNKNYTNNGSNEGNVENRERKRKKFGFSFGKRKNKS